MGIWSPDKHVDFTLTDFRPHTPLHGNSLSRHMAKIAQEWLEEYEKKFKAFKGPLHSSQHNLIKYALA